MADLTGDVVTRLRRIEGQVRGIEAMVSARAPYTEVLTQIAAVRAALHAAGMALIDSLVYECLEVDDPDRDDARELATALRRFVR